MSQHTRAAFVGEVIGRGLDALFYLALLGLAVVLLYEPAREQTLRLLLVPMALAAVYALAASLR